MKTKIYFIVLLWVLCSNKLIAQNWLWAKNFTGTCTQFGSYIATKPDGDVYCFGGYQSNGNFQAGNVTISSIGNFDAFVAQFDSSGNFITLTNAPSTTADQFQTGYGGEAFVSRTTTDDSSNMYIAINITDNGLIDTIPVTGSPNIVQMALTRWTSNCRCSWVHTFPGLQISPKYYQSNIYLVGSYQQPVAQIGNFQLNDPTNKQQGYLAGLDMAGNCTWVKQATGGNTLFNSLDVNENHIYITAQTDSCFIYDTLSICSQSGQYLQFLMQIDTTGSIIWSKSIRANNKYTNFGITSAIKGGGFYALNYLYGEEYIDSDTLRRSGNDSIDILIIKFDDSGNLLWTQNITVNTISLTASVVDSLGYLYLAGYITGTQTFGNYTVTAQSASDLFVTRYTPSGHCMGVVTVPNTTIYDMTQDNAGNAIVTGVIEGTAVFGNTTLNGDANGDFFVAKLSAITDSTTSVQSLLPNDGVLQIYANPSRGLFTIVVPPSIVQANSGNLTIYDSQGSIVTNQTVDISSSHLQVDLGEITRGVYTVLLTANGKEFRGRVVIQ